MESLNDTMNEGFEQHCSGYLLSDNPYLEGSDLHHFWRVGWYTAQEWYAHV